MPSEQWQHSLFFFIAVTIVLNVIFLIKTDKKTFTGILLFSSVFKFLLSLIMVLIYLLRLETLFFNFFTKFISINWYNRYLKDINGNTTVDWQNRWTIDGSVGGNKSLDWNNRYLYDSSQIISENIFH
jgi:hypothetical protein